MVAAHRARLTEAQNLLRRFQDLGGEQDDFATAVRGFGLAIGHLLDEDLDAAQAEIAAAWAGEARRPASYLSFIHGPHLLLAVLTGRAGPAECADLAGSAQAQARWNHQFLVLSRAVLDGRAGRVREAAAGLDTFLVLSKPYPPTRHLGLRLAAPEAIAHGWGEPAGWLRATEAYFHETAPRVARTCRDLLRRTGAPVPQHRRGIADVPAHLRERGITVREGEVLVLVAEGLVTREIGRRLFLSPRTVEKHIGRLLAKTGAADRTALAVFATGSENMGRS
jgi:DNA-binding CsgD family transcriptional regulator